MSPDFTMHELSKTISELMEVSKSAPTAASFLELGILPIQYEIEKRQFVFFEKF